MNSFRSFLAVFVGGGFGSLLRFAVGTFALQRFGPGFPWGTLFINVTGSFVIGAIAELALTRTGGITPGMRLFLMVGICGGYTTFSTYAFETVTLIGDRALGLALLYSLGSVVAGVVACFLGFAAARAFGHA